MDRVFPAEPHPVADPATANTPDSGSDQQLLQIKSSNRQTFVLVSLASQEAHPKGSKRLWLMQVRTATPVLERRQLGL